MTLTAGTKLGPYEIQSLLGAGGMGEVYRARDGRLGRDVALKILPESLARDAERLHRFEQESRAVAALNHPNILAIYDVGNHAGTPFLVSELLEGESLRAIFDRGALPQRKVIDYGVQIAQGLAAAHEKGIIHRDLKPENLFLTKEGRAKILDFGLAKLAQAQSEAVDGYGATMASAGTAVGVVMGTASYMAPEQVRGESVDARTDIFALGAVLFEMLTGRQVFHRDTLAETMTAVLKDDLPETTVTALPVSPALDRIVRRCLEKSADQRFQSAKDLSFALGVLSGSEISGAVRVARAAGKDRTAWMWATFALLMVGAAASAWWFLRPQTSKVRMEFAIPLNGEVRQLSISADGRMLAFISPDDRSGVPMLFVQSIGGLQAAELAATENASYPFWSPDDSYVAFFSNNKLQKIPAAGGAPQAIARVSYARGGSWGSKNVILYSPDASSAIWQVNADGTNAKPLTSKFLPGIEDSHRWPLFLPDGEHFLFLYADFSGLNGTGNYIHMSSLHGGEDIRLIAARSNPGYADAHLFYVDDKGALRAIAFDAGKQKVSGDPQLIAEAVGFQPSVYWGAFTVGGDGTVVYSRTSMAAKSVLTFHGRDGKELQRIGEPAVQANPALSPDGTEAALDITDLKAVNLDIWIEHLGNGTSTRFTFNPGEDTTAAWSRDGRTLAYRADDGQSGAFLKDVNGMNTPKRLMALRGGTTVGGLEGSDIMPTSWSADGKQILCTLQGIGSRGSLLALIPAEGGEPVALMSGNASQTNGQISPDGKWVAYASNESGDWEIYVTTFPGAQGTWQISRGGGTEPRWRGDGKEMFYLSPTGMLMAVPIDAGASFASGTPAPLFQVHARPPISATDLFSYDVTKDGKRFLVNEYVKPAHIDPLSIVLHAVPSSAK
ncbi:MAG TPA: protein kinase [Candidatus Koribacter sp.]